MSRIKSSSWISPQVSLRFDGADIVLENPVPLAEFPANIGEWLRLNAERFPDRPFIVQRDASGEWRGPTYSEALSRVNRLSNGMLAQGLDSTRPLAILSENSVEMALVQLAAMQIGIAVAPISFAYSALSETGGHLRHILELAQPPLLVMSDATLHMPKLSRSNLSSIALYAVSNAERFPGVQPLSALESAEGSLSKEGERRFASVGPDTLAKIQFTSGSTNLPKGALVTHGMMTSNQVGIAQMWPFVGLDEVIVDFLPWNHTFGGNFVANMILMHGGTLHIDRGNPAPQGFETMARNIADVRPTMYFGVPRSYSALYARMKADTALRESFFSRLKFMFTAAAALDQRTFEGMQAMSVEARGGGEPIPFFAAWGMTETSPDATLVYWPTQDARVIGLPIPGVSVKLAADASGKREIRVRGACVTRGYYRNPEATARIFDHGGYLRTGDAAVIDANHPETGLIFDGRIGEDFKLTSGTWVHNARLRGSVNALGQPYLTEVVVAAPNRDFLAALVFPNVAALRARFTEVSAVAPDDADFLGREEVRAFFAGVFAQHNQRHQGSSERFARCVVLTTAPRLDLNETTDKGYINQIAVLRNRADMVEALYQDSPGPEVIVLAE